MRLSSATFFELFRWIGSGIGLYMAYRVQNNPKGQVNILTFSLIISLAGLTGIESFFLGKEGARQLGYERKRTYQRQSGMALLSFVFSSLLVYWLKWSIEAKAALFIALLFFLLFSALHHASSALREGNRSIKNSLRPSMRCILLGMLVPLLIRAFI